MDLDQEYALTVYKKIKIFREHHVLYWISGDSPVLEWPRIVNVACDLYGFHVEVNEVSANIISTQGMLLRYEGTVTAPHIVLIQEDLQPPRKNFVISKEICNLMIDEKEDWSPDGCAVIRGMREHLLIEAAGNTTAKANRFVTSDLFSQIVAIELLYPFKYRQIDFEKRQANDQSFSFNAIAETYKLPARMVEIALFPDNHNYTASIWKIIDNEQNA